jgi:prophage antirepressor-like protein
MSKTNKKKRCRIINLDDPNLVIGDDDFTTEFLKEVGTAKKKAIKSTKNIVKRLLDEDDKIEIVNADKNEKDENKIKNIFDYEGNTVLVIVDKEGKPWCKAKDLAIILQYKNTKDAIIKHVSKKYKKSYADMVANHDHKIKIDPRTIFLSQPGTFQLIFHSKMSNAIRFYEWIVEEVIPEILQFGTYSMKSPSNELEKLTKDFYQDNEITDYLHMHVIYLAYIGQKNEKYILKFGVSGNYPRRELKEHRSTYKDYNIIKIWPCIANYKAEKKIKKEMREKKVLVDGKELIALNGVFTLDKCIKVFDKIINNTKSRYEEENENIIQKLKNENELLTQKMELLNDKINLLSKK